MLGLGRASQYAGWWSSGVAPAVVTMNSVSTLNYKLTQSPAFSILGSKDDDTLPSFELEPTGLSDLALLPVYNDNKGWTIATTFYLDWDVSQVNSGGNRVYGFFHQVKFVQGASYPSTDFNAINCFAQISSGNLYLTSRMESQASGIFRNFTALPGSWELYNQRWMTLIYSSSNTPASFSNYTGGSVGAYNTRSCLYDTQTGVNLQTLDLSFSASFPGMTDWTYQSGSPPELPANLSASDGFQTTSSAPAAGSTPYQKNRIGMMWGTFGSAFDPAVLPNTGILTNRPPKVLGNSTACYNIPFADYVAGSGADPYYIANSGQDVFASANDRTLPFTFDGNATQFGDTYSSTIIPNTQG